MSKEKLRSGLPSNFGLLEIATDSNIVSLVNENSRSGCTEGHWIYVVVSPLLNLV